MSDIVFILGAGASRDCGGPLMSDYHDIKISSGDVYRVLKRYNLNCLPGRQRKRSIPTIRYEKQVPGHHVQVDVKFLDFKVEEGKNIQRFQYTAIDDAAGICT